jgi:hypothetical protein
VSRYRLIEAERTSFSVPLMCRMLGVSRGAVTTAGGTESPPEGAEKTPLSPRRSERSTGAAEKPTAPRGSTPSYDPSEPDAPGRGWRGSCERPECGAACAIGEEGALAAL